MAPLALLLSTGNEVVDGRIENSNAVWLAQQLRALGYRIARHVSVRDSIEDIVEALHLSDNCQLVVATGGLGPTEDDCTVDAACRWLGIGKHMDPSLWEHVQRRLREHNVSFQDNHQSQCFVPDGAQVYLNSRGTAPGLSLSHEGTKLFLLPGPPHEMRNLFEVMKRELVGHVPERILSFRFCGVPESEVEALGQQVFQGHQLSLQLQRPLVELRVEETKETLEQKKRLETSELFKEYLVETGSQNNAALFLQKSKPLTLVDGLTDGYALTRLLKGQQILGNSEFLSRYIWASASTRDTPKGAVVLRWISENEWTVSSLDAVFTLPQRLRRRKRLGAEVAFELTLKKLVARDATP